MAKLIFIQTTKGIVRERTICVLSQHSYRVHIMWFKRTLFIVKNLCIKNYYNDKAGATLGKNPLHRCSCAVLSKYTHVASVGTKNQQ